MQQFPLIDLFIDLFEFVQFYLFVARNM